MNTIAIKDIKFKSRQRKTTNADHVAKLARSIKEIGLINPITLDREDNSLLAGMNRVQAYMKLGREEIPFTYRDELDELTAKRIELEENLHRLNLEWWEEANAVAEIHELQKQIADDKGEPWTMQHTAKLVGKSVGTVQQSTKLAEEIKKNPEIKKEKKLTTALNKVTNERKIEQRKKEIALKEKGKLRTVNAEIVVGDSAELIRAEPSGEYDAILTNFPFGVEYGYTGKQNKVYDDDEDYIVDLVRTVVHEGLRVLKNDSWFVGFFDIRKITYSNHQRKFATDMMNLIRSFPADKLRKITGRSVKELSDEMAKSLGLAYWFEEAGYNYVNVMPAIWAKPNKVAGNIGDPNKGLIVAYEAAIFACKGDAMLFKKGRSNLFTYETLTPSQRDFEMQMPVELCSELVKMTCLGGAKILDPFAGVGSFGEGAIDNQCYFKGFELNEKRAETGNLRLRERSMGK